MAPNDQPAISLIYPPGAEARTAARAPAPSADDLALAPIAAALDSDGRHGRFIAGVLAELSTDPVTIDYRQQVLTDLLRLPETAATLRQLLPELRGLAESGARPGWGDQPALLRLAERLAELDAYVGCVEGMAFALDAAGEQLASKGLRQLQEVLAAVRVAPDYRQLAAVLPELRSQLEHIGSVTLGINLDAQFRPESATILEVGKRRFTGKAGLLERLLGSRPAEETTRGIGALHRADAERAYTSEHLLFRELNGLLEQTVSPLLSTLESYRRLSSRWLAAVEPELAFLLGAARLFSELSAAGLPCCRPEIAPVSERCCVIEGSYSLDLALRLRADKGSDAARAIVPNDVVFDEQARILLITGPNSGGKTTYTRAVGQAQVLFQSGLLVPGQRARLSPVDGIFSHFAAAERPEQAGGRLEEELARLQAIFAQVSRNSLLLINEPFTSTDHGAARLLARDLLAGLRLLDARAIYVTHLHELVEEALPTDDSAGGLVSLVAGAAPIAEPSSNDVLVSLTAGASVSAEPSSNGAPQPAPTYRVTRGRPQQLGHAQALARRYGLSREQIAAGLRERGVLL